MNNKVTLMFNLEYSICQNFALGVIACTLFRLYLDCNMIRPKFQMHQTYICTHYIVLALKYGTRSVLCLRAVDAKNASEIADF